MNLRWELICFLFCYCFFGGGGGRAGKKSSEPREKKKKRQPPGHSRRWVPSKYLKVPISFSMAASGIQACTVRIPAECIPPHKKRKKKNNEHRPDQVEPWLRFFFVSLILLILFDMSCAQECTMICSCPYWKANLDIAWLPFTHHARVLGE